MSRELNQENREKLREMAAQIANKNGLEADSCEELQSHLEDKAQDYMSGNLELSPDDVVLLVKEHFGDPAHVQDLLQRVHGRTRHGWVDDLTSYKGKFDIFSVLHFPWTGCLVYGVFIFVLVEMVATVSLLFIIKKNPHIAMHYLAWIPTLAGLLFALLFYGMYRVISNKVEQLKVSLKKQVEYQTDGIVVHGATESPGIIQYDRDSLILTPLMGNQVIIPRSKIQNIESRRMGNGRLYVGNNGFIWIYLKDDDTRLGIAIPQPGKWKSIIEGPPAGL